MVAGYLSATESGEGARRWARRLVPLSVALLLFSAAALKGYELFAVPLSETSLWDSRGFRIAGVEAEFALGVWLLSGLWPRQARWAALAAFAAFFAASLWKAFAGDTSCGCFGRLSVSPRWTAALDAVTLLVFGRWTPANPEGVPVRWGSLLVAGALLVVLFIGVPVGIVLAGGRPASLEPDAELEVNQSLVVLEPENWVGRRCPLLRYTDVGAEVAHGRWLLVLYHHDCPRCRTVVPAFEARARATAADPGAPRIALVAVPPHGTPPWGFPARPACRHGRLDDGKNWFVATPAVLRLQDGVVQPQDNSG
jgi:hypothetical protein